MFGVCFRHERQGWLQDQWSWVFSNFGVTEIWERGHDPSKDGDIYQDVIEITTAAELPADRPLVVLAPPAGRYIQGDVSLKDFVHPEDAIYLFGATQANLSDEDDLGGRAPETVVYIPSVEHEVFGYAAAYMTLWDRYAKRGDFG